MVTGRGTVIVIRIPPLFYINPLTNQSIIIIVTTLVFGHYMDVTSSVGFVTSIKRCLTRGVLSLANCRAKIKVDLSIRDHISIKVYPSPPSSPSSALPIGDCPLKSTALKTLSHFMQIAAFTVNTYNNTSTLLTGDMVTETLSIFFKNNKRELIVFCLMRICHCQN